MKPKKSAKPKKVTPPEPVFTVTYTQADQIYKGKGPTVLAALQAVPRPAKITTKGYIQITDGTRSKNLPLTVDRAKRFFYPMAQAFLAKQLALGLK